MLNIDPYINLIIALLGLAYPILLQVIARLDEKYESENIASLFKREFEWSAFRYTLVAALVSVFIWSLKLEPLINVEEFNFVINNSAILFVVFTTILLVISFFLFVRKVLKYFTPYSLIPYLIMRHGKSKSDVKYIPALTDLLLLSIKRQQTNLSRTLSDFFYTAFRKVRDKFIDEPVVYPALFYETVYKAIEELALLKEKRNYLLEHRTSGGIWLIGEQQGKEISERTYSWLWQNLLLAVKYQQDDLIVNHWETCHQYYNYNLPYISPMYNNTAANFQVTNQQAVDKRVAEREKFIEFHYALGGLLTYKQRYACLKRLFSHTQSQPPRYELLPESMYEVFKFYFDVGDLYDRKYTWISNLYPFPELSGLNADNVIKKWIRSYMAILFLRQYTIFPHLITMRPLDFPPIPSTQGEIKEWIDDLDFFKRLVSEHLENKELLKTLNLDFLTPEWFEKNAKPHPIAFIETFKSNLERAYHINSLNLPISDEKVKQFENATKTIIESVNDRLKVINNDTTISDENSDKWYVSGKRMLQSKDAFSENPEVHHMEFDSFLAGEVSRSLIEGTGTTFLYKRTKSYLLKLEDFFKAIDRLGIDDSFVIVTFGLNLEYLIDHIKIAGLTNERYKNISIYSFSGSRTIRDTLFVIRKSDLPNISIRPIDADIIEKYTLKKISNTINLYSSVIDLNNTSEEVYNEEKHDKSDDDLRRSVLLCIIISVEFKWKKNIEVIQLQQHSDFFQRGIANKLDDVKPLENKT